MKAEERNIGRVLTETVRYTIPAYQRPYSWNQDNVQQLLEDIQDAFDDGDPEYFIGSIITIERERDATYEIVDGQQRLTTLNLIFVGLRNRITDAAAKQALASRVLPSNPLTQQTETPRLTLRPSDQTFFRRHILESVPLDKVARNELDEPKAHLADNLDIIDTFLEEKQQEWMKHFANFILQRVFLVLVQTESFKSAYRLFNVLNDRGLDLSNADLIKNRLFALLVGPGNSDTLEEKWVELESVAGIDNLDTFLGYHRTAVVAAKARKSLAEEYEFLTSKGIDPVGFVEALILSAKNFERLRGNNLNDSEAERSVAALLRVSYDEWIPAMLAFLNRPVGDLPLAEFADLLERITMQNWVRRLGRTARLTIYYRLISAVNSGKQGSEIREIFRAAANNEEFFSLLDGSVYGLPAGKAVLLGLEDGAQDHSVKKTYSGPIHIEHILPQALKDDYWTARFSLEEHARWLHRLGNITLLSAPKNFSARNFAFQRKKQVYEELMAKASFDLTKEVCTEPDWTLETIAKRQDRLMAVAKKLWTIE